MTHGSRTSALVALLSLAAGLAACRSPRGGSAREGAMVVSHAVVVVPTSPSEATGFLVLENRGSAPVTLIGAGSPDAEAVRVHSMASGRMDPVDRLAIPPGGRVLFGPGRYHLMLEGLRRTLAAGDTVSLELRFDGSSALTVRAPVLRYTEAVSEMPAR